MHRYLKYGYLIVICTLLPLYMKYGYFELGEAKGLCYMVTGAVFALLFLIVDNKKLFSVGRLPKHVAYALLAFLASNVLSLIFSVDKKVSFFGLSGWRSGLASILLMVFFFYVFYEKEAPLNKYIFAAMLLTPAFECVLGILHRFGVYPFDLYGSNSMFLATIGNINWYTCFLSVFVPLGVGISFSQKFPSKEFFLISAFSLLSLMALLLQGSDSGLLVLAGTYIVLLFFALSSQERFRKFLLQLFILGLAMEICGLLILAIREGYNYDANILKSICEGHVGAIIMAAVLLIYRSSRLFEEIKLKWHPLAYRIAAGVIVAAAIAVIAAIILKDMDYDTGNGRVLIYSICLDMFREMPVLHKFFGVGQECLSVYAYSDPVTAESLYNVFDFNTLTNAHCDLLTILIERGILGVFTYLALLSSFAVSIWSQKNKHAALVCALILSSFFLTSLVSFSLVISAPYMFLAMGIGLSWEKK